MREQRFAIGEPVVVNTGGDDIRASVLDLPTSAHGRDLQRATGHPSYLCQWNAGGHPQWIPAESVRAAAPSTEVPS